MALPGYGVARTTLDLDVAIYFTSQQDILDFLHELEKYNIKTAQVPKSDHLLFVIFSKDYPDEAEIWLAPCDAFSWNEEIIKRIRLIDNESKINILSPEDYITTKLARADRSSVDIQDILEILLAQENKIEWDYLLRRVNNLQLFPDFHNILLHILKNKPDFNIPHEFIQPQ